MVKRKTRKAQSKANSDLLKGIAQLTSKDIDRPVRPIDTGPYPGGDPINQFLAVIDPLIGLSDDAARRIEKALRQAVLSEIAATNLGSEVVVSGFLPQGCRGITVRVVRD